MGVQTGRSYRARGTTDREHGGRSGRRDAAAASCHTACHNYRCLCGQTMEEVDAGTYDPFFLLYNKVNAIDMLYGTG